MIHNTLVKVALLSRKKIVIQSVFFASVATLLYSQSKGGKAGKKKKSIYFLNCPMYFSLAIHNIRGIFGA